MEYHASITSLIACAAFSLAVSATVYSAIWLPIRNTTNLLRKDAAKEIIGKPGWTARTAFLLGFLSVLAGFSAGPFQLSGDGEISKSAAYGLIAHGCLLVIAAAFIRTYYLVKALVSKIRKGPPAPGDQR